MEPEESTGVRVVHRGTDVDGAIAEAAPADVVLLDPDCEVADGWLEGLRAAAYSDTRIASATALPVDRVLTEHMPRGRGFEEAAKRVREASLRIRPRIDMANGPCTYIRRNALELVGGFDGLQWFSERCLRLGLCHAVADDVLVLPVQAGGASFDTPPSAALARAIGIARRALEGLSIVIDARILSGPMNGSKRHTLELVAAIARVGGHQVKALVGEDLSSENRALLEAVPGVELTTLSVDGRPARRADVVHRPFQVESPADLAVLASLGDRLVITQQDVIGYHNRSYFPSDDGWRGYRALTRRAMAVADHVVFFTAHAREESLAEDLVEPGRASVVHIGVDHSITPATDAVAPRGAERIQSGAEVVLCIGTDYLHKNRLFAMRMLAELRHRHQWGGWLVFAGSKMPFGGSGADEARFVDQHPDLADAVLDVGEVSEPEKEWLLRRASLVLYPTVYEGFGLIPFEAAEHGVPCLWAKGISLSELLPDAAAGIVPWEPVASADRALELMRDERVRDENIDAVRGAADQLRWDAAGQKLVEIYRATCDAPASLAGLLERGEGLMRGGLSEDALRLVGPNGALPRDLERPLLALATHPRLRAPVFSAIRAGYRAYRWRSSRINGGG